MAEKYTSILNHASYYSAIQYCFSLAEETGIFTTLINAEKPLTSHEIANETKIIERYARQMLGCLSAVELAKVSTNQDGDNVYSLDEAAKDALKTGACSLAEMKFPRMIGSRYDQVKDCLGADKSGALRYQQSFLDFMEDTRTKGTPAVIDCLLKNVPGLMENLKEGIDVIEFGCGRAIHLSTLATMFPKSNFRATDVNPDFLEVIKKRYSHISNMTYDVADLYAIPETVDQKYDFVYMNDVVHDLPRPVEALKGIRRMLKKNGICGFVDYAGTGSHQKDVGDLFAAYNYAMATFFCIPESFQSPDSEAHGASIGKETMIGYLRDAGFEPTCASLGRLALYIAQPA